MKRGVNNMHEIKRTNEIDIHSFIRNSNDLIILITASYCQEDSCGTYTCRLIYKEHTKVITAVLHNMPSANLTTVLGVFDAVKQIKLTGVNVCVISYIPLGFKSGNGLYSYEVNAIVRMIASQGNTLSSITIPDGKDVVKNIIAKGQ